MSEEYVTNRVLEDFAKRMDAREEAARAREEAHEARTRAEIAEIRGEVKELRVTVQDMKSDMAEIKADIKSVRYNLIGWSIGFAAVVIAGVQVLLAVRGG